MPDFAGPTGLATKELRRLDQILSGRGTGTMRFSAGESLRAIMAPVSVLLANPQSSVTWAEINSVPVKKLQEHILFVSDAPAASEIGGLLALIAKQSPESARPGWIAIPGSLETSRNALVPKIQDAGPAGAVVIRNKQDEPTSFNLYPFEAARNSASGFEPVKTKVPEPAGNLRARGEWFRRRSGGR